MGLFSFPYIFFVTIFIVSVIFAVVSPILSQLENNDTTHYFSFLAEYNIEFFIVAGVSLIFGAIFSYFLNKTQKSLNYLKEKQHFEYFLIERNNLGIDE